MSSAITQNEHCHYVVPRKKRRCRMLIKPGHVYCGEHSHLLEKPANSNQDDIKDELFDDKRIPCPLDPKHSCAAKSLEKHLKKCPSKLKPNPDYVSKGINMIQSTSPATVNGLTISKSSDEQLLDLIERLEKVYDKIVKIQTEILKHQLIEDEIEQEHIGPSAAKHLVQNSSLLGHLEDLGTFKIENANIIEFGSGRGQMTFWMAKTSKKDLNQKFILVDKASHRHKYDNKLKDDEELQISRIKADIQDLVIEKIPEVQASKGPVIGVSKHLCGAATDLALYCLKNYAQSSGNHQEIQKIVIALCCHHRCDWLIYVGKSFLLHHGFKPEEFSLLCGLTSWATCGTGRPREDTSEVKNAQKDLKENNEQMLENPHNDRYGRLGLSRIKREEIGRKSKRFLDMGRCDFIENHMKLKTRLAYYVDSEITLENVVLIASK